MTINLIKFLFVWSLVILTFGCVGLLMFNHVKTFSSTTGAFYFLICAALGNWDASIFDLVNWDSVVNPQPPGDLLVT
jgi:hypothetical protein